MNINKWMLTVVALTLTGCGVTQPIDFKGTNVITRSVYTQSRASHGVVLLDINWGRWWGCGGPGKNAQLLTLAFDRLPPKSFENESEPSLVINSPSRLFVHPVFLNHAFSLEPGEYALSAVSIKVAEFRPTSVGYLAWQRSELYKDGKPMGGTFTVQPGETVFIGNFYLDCAYGPTLWRYYPEDREYFDKQIEEYRNKFPFLDLGDVKYRLFKTKHFGYDYELTLQSGGES